MCSVGVIAARGPTAAGTSSPARRLAMGCKVLRSSRAQQPRQVLTPTTRRTPRISRIIVVAAAAAAGLLMMMMMVAGCQAEDVTDDAKIGDIRDSIVEALGLQRIPDPAKVSCIAV